MSTIAEYLTALEGLRDQIADNLVKLGINASRDETLKTLVPKLLGIQQGDMRHECFAAKMQNFPISYGFFSFNEIAALVGAIEVEAFYMIRSAEINIDAAGGLSRLNVVAPNWQITQSDTKISMVCDVIGKSRAQFTDLLDLIRISITGTEALSAQVTMIVIGDETGNTLAAAGSTSLRFQKGNWETLEARNYTWNDIETQGYTWQGLENLGKP